MKSVSLNGNEVYPSKIVCIGRNYVGHIEELGNELPEEPVVFIKPNSAIDEVLRPGVSEPLHYEGELSFMVESGRLAAVGFGLDLTLRELQSRLKAKGLPWERAKAFDGAALFSRFVACPDDIRRLRLELVLNGQVVQWGAYELMINKPKELLAAAAQFLSFEDGDLLMTGTPAGVGVVNPGDRFLGRVFDADKLLVEAEWVVR